MFKQLSFRLAISSSDTLPLWKSCRFRMLFQLRAGISLTSKPGYNTSFKNDVVVVFTWIFLVCYIFILFFHGRLWVCEITWNFFVFFSWFIGKLKIHRWSIFHVSSVKKLKMIFFVSFKVLRLSSWKPPPPPPWRWRHPFSMMASRKPSCMLSLSSVYNSLSLSLSLFIPRRVDKCFNLLPWPSIRPHLETLCQ